LIDSLLASRSGTKQGVNFTQFLSMMGEHLFQLDPEHELKEAFACFDEGDKGYVSVSEMRKALAEMGDRMDDAEVGVVSLATPADAAGWMTGRVGADPLARLTDCSMAHSQIDRGGSIMSNLPKSFE
jgi:hypothetical protein